MAGLVVNSSTSFMCILYVVLGFVSISCSCFNLWIWLSSRLLRRKYVYVIGLEIGELVNGISYILVGSGRGLALLGGYLTDPITVRQCFFEKYWPHSLILGTELPSFGIILISCERLCAVLRPGAYNRIFMSDYKLLLLLLVFFAGMFSVLIGGLSTIGFAGSQVSSSQHCPIIASTAIWYSTFHFVFIVLANVVSFISVFIVWKITKRYENEIVAVSIWVHHDLRDSERSSRLSIAFRFGVYNCLTRSVSTRYASGKVGGDNRLGIMLIITGTSIVLISSESVVMLSISWGVYAFNDMVVALTYAMPGFLSVSNTVVNLIFRRDFRQRVFAVIYGRKTSARTHTPTVFPATKKPTRILTVAERSHAAAGLRLSQM